MASHERSKWHKFLVSDEDKTERGYIYFRILNNKLFIKYEPHHHNCYEIDEVKYAGTNGQDQMWTLFYRNGLQETYIFLQEEALFMSLVSTSSTPIVTQTASAVDSTRYLV